MKSKSFHLPEGQELLNGLYTVQNYMQRENDKLNEFWKLEKEYRDNIKSVRPMLYNIINTSNLKEKSEYGFFIAGIAFCLTFGGIGLLSGNIINLIFCLIITAVFAKGKIESSKDASVGIKNKYLKIGKFLLVVLFLLWLVGIKRVFKYTAPAGSLFYLVINIIALVIASVVAKITLNKYNKKIEKHNEAEKESATVKNKRIKQENEQIQHHNGIVCKKRQGLAIEIQELVNELQAETSMWYPVDYYSLDAVAQFITIVKNHEADTIKEMLAIYKQDAFRIQVLNNQSTMISQLNQSLYNQQEMISLQRKSNMIKLASCAASFITAVNSSAIKANTAATAANTQHIVDNMKH